LWRLDAFLDVIFSKNGHQLLMRILKSSYRTFEGENVKNPLKSKKTF